MENGTIAKTILAGCYKFGHETLLRRWGTMTSVIEYEEEELTYCIQDDAEREHSCIPKRHGR